MANGVDATDPAAADDELARREGVHGGQALRGDVPLHAPVAVAHVHGGVLADHGPRLRRAGGTLSAPLVWPAHEPHPQHAGLMPLQHKVWHMRLSMPDRVCTIC